jgi:hypothetical protein
MEEAACKIFMQEGNNDRMCDDEEWGRKERKKERGMQAAKRASKSEAEDHGCETGPRA